MVPSTAEQSNPVDRILPLLTDVRSRGQRFTAKCPVPKCTYRLSIDRGHDGRVLLYCNGGCGAAEVTAALGLTVHALFPARRRGREQ